MFKNVLFLHKKCYISKYLKDKFQRPKIELLKKQYNNRQLISKVDASKYFQECNYFISVVLQSCVMQ